MALTMQDVMDLPIMKSSNVVTGASHMHEQEVEWVSVIETPVENFVRKNEFVLSTGIGCGQDPKLLGEFIRDVFASGASALGIALGRHVFDIPQEVVELAEARNLILVEIPWEVRFSDITHSVMTKLNGMKRDELRKSEKNQQHLIEMILRGKGLSEIARFIEKEVGLQSVILDRKGSIKGKSRDAKRLTAIWDDQSEHSPVKTIAGLDGTQHHPLHSKFERIQYKEADMLKIRIHSSGAEQGSLYVLLEEKETDLSPDDINLLEHAVTAAALWFLRESAIIETEMRLQDDFIWGLAKGELAEETLHSRARLLGYAVTLPYVCILGTPENLEDIFEKNHAEYTSYKHWSQSMVYYMEEEALYAGEQVQRRMMTTFQDNKLIIYLETPKTTNHETVNHFLDLVERRLNHFLPGVVISWGIGQHDDGVMAFRESYLKAKSALDMGRTQKGPGNRVDFEDTKVNRLLLNLAQNPDIQEITKETISPLVEYDRKRQMDLLGTFTAYNRHNGNVSQTARMLNLHRQSLLYRLRKIESLTGLSLLNPDDIFLLDLSIRIWSTGSLE